jgi:hypothetical protein
VKWWILTLSLATLAAGCGGGHGATGTVVGGIVPGGLHAPGLYVAGSVKVAKPEGHVVKTVSAQQGKRFHVQLQTGSYELSSAYLGELCVGHATVHAGKTTRANVICAAK